MASTSAVPLPVQPSEDLPPSSPTTSDASDSDAFNTESTRVYFGPIKTPERELAARTQYLFPSTDDITARHQSPHLSKPQEPPRSHVPEDDGSDDAEDMEQVERIVSERRQDQDEEEEVRAEEEEEEENPAEGSPQRVELLIPDEPSSALANKILHAMDNPSPPPSPPPLLAMFDPYHTNDSEPSVDTNTTTVPTDAVNGPLVDLDNPLLLSVQPSVSVAASPQPPVLVGSVTQGDLISFDSPLPRPTPSTPPRITPNTLPAPFMDDFLTNSPAFARILVQPNTNSDPIPSVNVREAETPDAMDVTPNPTTPDRPTGQPIAQPELISQLVVAAQVLTPLRRSPRPRRSVTPNPLPLPPPSDPETPSLPPLSRTRIKRRGMTPLSENVDSEMEDVQNLDEGGQRREASPTRRTGDRRQSSPRRPILSRRELGSLSPTSSSLLNTLGFGKVEEPEEPQPEKPAEPFSFSVFRPPPPQAPTETPLRTPGPMRIISPVKLGGASPTKFKIQAPATSDPTNTPARRVLIGPPDARDPASQDKVPNPALLTPARRVLVPDPTFSASSRLPTKVRETPGKASTSKVAEPSLIRSVLNGKGKEKAIERPVPSASSVSSSSTKINEGTKPPSSLGPKPLPFPIVASPLPAAPPPQTTVSESKREEAPAPAKVLSPKSGLKKPTSKIPRIGMKPYARVNPSKTADKVKAAAAARVIIPPPPKAAVQSTSTSSTTRPRPTVTTPTASSILKRKREAEKSSPVKPRVGRPVITRRAEVPPKPAASASNAVRVVGTSGRISPSEGTVIPSGHPPLEPGSEPVSSQPSTPPPSSPSPRMADSSALPPGSPMNQDNPPLAPFALSTTSQPNVHPPPSVIPSMTQATEPVTVAPVVVAEPPMTTTATTPTNEPMGSLPPIAVVEPRRATRSARRGGVASSSTASDRPARAARRAATSAATFSYQGNDVFSTMSMTALKDLTATNTAKNQQYVVAKLETEVIRKEGDRPDSPLIKIKSIAQRQQEERERQRSERALRRARRSSEDPNGEAMAASSDVEIDGGYSSPCEEYGERHHASGTSRHVRGAGDDDDYTTPEKPDKVVRKTKVIEGGVTEEYECIQRRVKWDKGLFTTVYLDQVKVGARQMPKDAKATKGALAAHAKARPLDPLGNPISKQADTFLAELVPEHVKVKKIVYEGDEPPPEEVVVVKNTRSRAKKK